MSLSAITAWHVCSGASPGWHRARWQAAPNNPRLSSLSWGWLFFFVFLLFGFVFFPFPANQRWLLGAPAQAPTPPQATATSSKAPSPCGTHRPTSKAMVSPRSPRTGGHCHQPTSPGGPCSGTSQPKACSRVLPRAALAHPMCIRLQRAGASARGSARGEPGTRVSRVHAPGPECTRTSVRGNTCKFRRVCTGSGCPAASLPAAPCAPSSPVRRRRQGFAPTRVSGWQSHPLTRPHCQHPGLCGKPPQPTGPRGAVS